MTIEVKKDQDGTIGKLTLLFWRLNWRLVSQKKYRLLKRIHSSKRHITEPFFWFEVWLDTLTPSEKVLWKYVPTRLNHKMTELRKNNKPNLQLKTLFESML